MNKLTWINGYPPDLDTQNRIWIVAEIPSLFLEKQHSYKTFVWLGNSWSDNAVKRATKWSFLPLPK
jgi:hypothetical protein